MDRLQRYRERLLQQQITLVREELKTCDAQIEFLASDAIDVWAEYGNRRVGKAEIVAEWQARHRWATTRLQWRLDDLRRLQTQHAH